MRKTCDFYGILLVLILISFESCSVKGTYMDFLQIEDGEWYHDSVLCFAFDSLKNGREGKYVVSIEVTSNRGYPYQDIWLGIEQSFLVDKDTLVRTDTLQCLLANKDGKWLGSGIGGLNQLSQPFDTLDLTGFSAIDSMRYCLHIRQIMADNPLKGVEKMGVKLMPLRITK